METSFGTLGDVGIALLILGLAAFLYAAALFNTLLRRRNAVEQAMEAHEAHTKQRFRKDSKTLDAYNTAVARYNQAVEAFPNRLLAGPLGFKRREPLAAEAPAAAPSPRKTRKT